MPHYRLYLLDPYTGHIESAEEVHAADDVAAVHATQLREFTVPVELWRGGRKVSHIDARPEAAAYSPVAAQPERSIA
jgi:hypothetical protein